MTMKNITRPHRCTHRVPVTAALFLAWSLVSCGGGGGNSPRGDVNSGSIPTLDGSTTLIPALSGSPYSTSLSSCVQASSPAESCTLSTLPTIGQNSASPTIEDIMERVVVSHPWMGERFLQLLEAAPQSLLPLMRSLTAIVVSADIRPSYYSSTTGAIYIDPAYLWLDNAEKATINKGQDFRADFGDEMSFASLARYVRGNDYAWEFYDLEGSETRTLNDIVLSTTRLLFHELAHANDFFPPQLLVDMDPEDTASEASDKVSTRQISRQLAAAQPLNSSLLFDMASVLYSGRIATSDDKAVSATDVGLAFEIDGATDDYAYSSIYEDTAMMFEEAMMAFHFGVAREIGFTDNPPQEGASCSDYVVRWGVRHRSGSELVAPRLTSILQAILQRDDVDEYIAALSAPTALENGVDWCSNLRKFSAEAPSAAPSTATPSPPPQIQRPLRRDDRGDRDLIF